MEKARSKLQVPKNDEPGNSPTPADHVAELVDAIEQLRPKMPPEVYRELRSVGRRAIRQVRAQEEAKGAYPALLGALATTGMTSLAYEHEMSKQVRTITHLAAELDELAKGLDGSNRSTIEGAAGALRQWEERAQAIRSLFAPLLTRETREQPGQFLAAKTLKQIAGEMQVLARQASIDLSGVPKDLRLPTATLPAWSSVFQNVLTNAFNALYQQRDPKIVIDGGSDKGTSWLRIMDNGAGVDLTDTAVLWQPFERRLPLPPEVERAGLGGMGLGLTIVKMILDSIPVAANFEQPPSGMATSLRMTWKDEG